MPPTVVTAAWDAAPQQLLVSWQTEASSPGAEIALFFADDGTQQRRWPVTHLDVHQLSISTATFPSDTVFRIGVRLESGGVWSDWTYTPQFDTDMPPVPIQTGDCDVRRPIAGITTTTYRLTTR